MSGVRVNEGESSLQPLSLSPLDPSIDSSRVVLRHSVLFALRRPSFIRLFY